MNTRCGMKKKKYTTRWLSGLLIVALILSSIVLPGSGTSVRADNLDDKTVSVENLEKESANKENLASLTDDKENLKNNITDSNNLDFKATDDENLKTRTVDNENINNNTSDNSNSEFNTANNNQNIGTVNNGNLDNGSGYTTEGSEGSNDTFPVATLSDDGIQLYANNSVNVNAEYFYEIEMEATSTNEHYIAKGIYVDANGNAHIVLGFQKNNNWKDIVKVKIIEVDSKRNRISLSMKGIKEEDC